MTTETANIDDTPSNPEPCFSMETQRDFQNYLSDPNNKSQAWFTVEECDSYRNWLMFPGGAMPGGKGKVFALIVVLWHCRP